jgi:hypothetical protein
MEMTLARHGPREGTQGGRKRHRIAQQRACPVPVSLAQPCDVLRVPSAREESIQSWRQLLGLADGGNDASDGSAVLPSSTSDRPLEQLLASTEWLMRRWLRQSWAVLRPWERQAILRAVRDFDPARPTIEVTAAQKRGAAWLLAAMHWGGCRHPAALRCEPLHPPTGLVRWLSMFDVRQQVESAGEIHELLIRRMADMERQSQRLIEEMLARGPTVALLPELLR